MKRIETDRAIDPREGGQRLAAKDEQVAHLLDGVGAVAIEIERETDVGLGTVRTGAR